MANIMAVLGLEIDASRATQGLRDVDRATDRTSKNVRELQQLLRGLGLAWGVYEVVQFTKSTIALADAYTTMQSRLALVSRDAENLASVQRDLFGIAQESRTPLESVSLLYERLARVSGELGLNQQELLRHTETINKAMVISGTSAEGTRAALVQLSQGFAAGTLRGDELNAVLEQAPRLAQAIADGMGVSVGELRRMGAEGKLTADAIVKALEDQAAAIDREFDGMAMTVDGSMTRLHNAWMTYVGDANQASGATSGLAEAINGLADAIEPVGSAVNWFFTQFALGTMEAGVAWEKFKASMAGALPDWMLTDEGRANNANASATIENLEAYRASEAARILGLTQQPARRAFGAGLGGNDDPALLPLSKEEERRLQAYQDLRQEMQYAREDLEFETRHLEQSTLAREYNRNALEHERRVREIMAEQAPQYHAELIRESEAVMAAANAHAQKTARMERERAEREALTIAIEASDAEERRIAEDARQRALDFSRDMRETLSDGIHGVLTDGLDEFQDFFDQVRDMYLGVVSDILAAAAQKRMAGAVADMLGDLVPAEVRAQIPGAGQGAFGLSSRQLAGVGAGLGGAMLGYGIGHATDDPVVGTGLGGMSGALVGSMIAPGIGTAIGAAAGAISGLVGGITGAGDAAEEARERMAAFDRSIRALEMQTAGDSLGLAMVEVEETIGRLLEQIGFSSSMTTQEAMEYAQRLKNSTGRNLVDDVERIIAVEEELYERAQERYDMELQRLEDDLSVRALVAQGRDDEAARLRLQVQHQRELDALTREINSDDNVTAAEEALLAQMEYTHQLERTAQAMNGLNRSAANLPATFKMAGYVFDAMQEMTADAYRRAVFGGTGSGMPSAPPSTIPSMPVASAGSGETVTLSLDQPFVLQIDGKVISRFTLRDWKRGASGPGSEDTAAMLGKIRVN